MNLFTAIIFGLLGFGVVSWLLELRKGNSARPRPQPGGDPFSSHQRQSNWPPRPAPQQDDLAGYCAELDIRQPFTRSELQNAYRRKVSEYHPDKVHNLGADIQELALKKTVAINAAYEKLQAYARP